MDLTGWKMDDNSDSSASAVPLAGVTSLPAGQSAVFFEDTGADDATIQTAFSRAWFGTAALPGGFLIGHYGGSGVGLGTGGDHVNIFDAAGNRVTGVASVARLPRRRSRHSTTPPESAPRDAAADHLDAQRGRRQRRLLEQGQRRDRFTCRCRAAGPDPADDHGHCRSRRQRERLEQHSCHGFLHVHRHRRRGRPGGQFAGR